MKTKTLTGNKKVLGMILGLVVLATVGGSYAFAQTAGTTTPGQGVQTTAPPQIQGSVNLQQLLLSNVGTKFTDAANTAAGSVTSGQVISGGLTQIQGSLVYAFKVTDGKSLYSVIVDAGNGKVLYTSQAHPLQIGGLLGNGMGHGGMMHKHGVGMGAWKSMQPSTASSSPPPAGTQS